MNILVVAHLHRQGMRWAERRDPRRNWSRSHDRKYCAQESNSVAPVA